MQVIVHVYYVEMLCLYLLGQNCLHFTLEPYLSSSDTYSRKYEELLNIVIHACKQNFYRNNEFVENVWPTFVLIYLRLLLFLLFTK